jgi:hypothetical protein
MNGQVIRKYEIEPWDLETLAADTPKTPLLLTVVQHQTNDDIRFSNRPMTIKRSRDTQHISQVHLTVCMCWTSEYACLSKKVAPSLLLHDSTFHILYDFMLTIFNGAIPVM